MNIIHRSFLVSILVMPWSLQTSFAQTASNPISNEMKNEMKAGFQLLSDGKFQEAIVKYDKICDSGIKNSCYAAAVARYSLALKLGNTEESLNLYEQITPVFEEICTKQIVSSICEKLPSILFNRGTILLNLDGSVSSGFKNGALHVTYTNNDGTKFPLSSKPEWPLVKKLWKKSCSLGLSAACDNLEKTSDVLDTIEGTRAPVDAAPTPSTSASQATAQTPPPPAAAPPSAAGSMSTQVRDPKTFQEEHANACISIHSGILENTCAFTVDVFWCGEGFDCKNGRFRNSWNIVSGGHYSTLSPKGTFIRFAACKGKDTLQQDMKGEPYSFFCRIPFR